MDAMSIYSMVKTLQKSSSPEPVNQFQGNLVCIIRYFKSISVFINHDPVTLIYFTPRSTWVAYAYAYEWGRLPFEGKNLQVILAN